MSRRSIAAKVIAWLCGLSAGWVTSNVIGNNTTANNGLQKAERVVGGIVIGSIVADAAEVHAAKKIDEIVAIFNKDEKPTIIVN